MENYKVEGESKEYCVLEQPSGHQVYFTGKKYMAEKMCNLLNEGSGFDGFTPDFFMRSVGTQIE